MAVFTRIVAGPLIGPAGAFRGTVRAAMGMQLMAADNYQRIMLVKMVSGVRLPTGRMMNQGEIKALVDACLNDYLKV